MDMSLLHALPKAELKLVAHFTENIKPATGYLEISWHYFPGTLELI